MAQLIIVNKEQLAASLARFEKYWRMLPPSRNDCGNFKRTLRPRRNRRKVIWYDEFIICSIPL